MREIEIKARVDNEAAVLKAATALGLKFGQPKKQSDLIFCWPGVKDYEEGSVWLRIRTENDSKVLFTLKKDNGRRMDSTEHELEIADSEIMERIVLAMGYEPYITMVKTRRKARLGHIELCLDEVEGLGTFIEAETLTDNAADHAQAVQKMWGVLHKLGIQKTSEVTDAYDVLLRKQTGAI